MLPFGSFLHNVFIAAAAAARLGMCLCHSVNLNEPNDWTNERTERTSALHPMYACHLMFAYVRTSERTYKLKERIRAQVLQNTALYNAVAAALLLLLLLWHVRCQESTDELSVSILVKMLTFASSSILRCYNTVNAIFLFSAFFHFIHLSIDSNWMKENSLLLLLFENVCLKTEGKKIPNGKSI